MSHLQRIDDGSDTQRAAHNSRNFITLIVYGILVRIGWIFKTESIVMPAIMDSIAGAGWLRGCLPMLNRLGQSISPLVGSERVRETRQKKFVLAAFVILMAVSFFALAATWYLLDENKPIWLPYLFLAIYGFFWFSVGLHNLSMSLLHGKLVIPNRRGRLMLMTTSIGSLLAIAAAWFLMRPWLAHGSQNFSWLFIATATPMLVAGVLSLTLMEPAVSSETDSKSLSEVFRHSWFILRNDRNFRLLAIVAATFGVSVTLVPHYQAYVRENLNWGLDACVPWVIAQNIGAAFFSVPFGQLADKYGYRLALKWTMIALCVAPLLTMLLLRLDESPQLGFQLVFFLLGLTPVTMRTFSNYTLEIADSDHQPIYLSTLGVCMAVPVILLSAPVGGMVDVIGFETVFVAIVAVLLLGWLLTFNLVEPRLHADDDLQGQSTVE